MFAPRSIFIYTILAVVKDTLIVTSIGAEAMPVLGAGISPLIAFAAFWLLGQMQQLLSARAVYQAALWGMLAAYVAFLAVVYPRIDSLQAHGLGDWLRVLLPERLGALATLAEHWSVAAFYCLADIWGLIGVSILFWSTANEICTIKEAKVVYPLIGICGNIAVVAAGTLLQAVRATLPKNAPPQDLFRTLSLAMLACGAMMSLTRIHAWGIANVVVASAFARGIFEVAWRHQLRTLYPAEGQYAGTLGWVQIANGAATITMMAIAPYIFSSMGWGVAALLPPLFVAVSLTAFFVPSVLAQNADLAPELRCSLGRIGVAVGAVAQVIVGSLRHALSDPAKEMVYISMSPHKRGRRKTAVDMLSTVVGKTGSSLLLAGMLFACGSLSAAMPVAAVAAIGATMIWLRSVDVLRRDMAVSEGARQHEGGKLAAIARDQELGEGVGLKRSRDDDSALRSLSMSGDGDAWAM
ncbi:unnamed protein product [Pedinophyceae sp. YPF-701]|nr:unnamed protein product [Pedinophyceae sp. YPF-701]